jgi:hypothetical protein
MYQQLLGYKVEEKLYLGVREQKRLNTTGLVHGYCQLFIPEVRLPKLVYLVTPAPNKHR